MAHTCQPMRLRTGTVPSRIPEPEQSHGDDREQGQRAEPDRGGQRDDEERPSRGLAERLGAAHGRRRPPRTPASAATSGTHDIATELTP